MSNARLPEIVTGRHRAQYGCLVTFENAGERVLTLHWVGPPLTALREACVDALALDPTFRVTAYSTPQTIWQDLQGREGSHVAGHESAIQLPEAKMLSRAGMNGMLHPRLVRASSERYHRGRGVRTNREMPA